MDNETRRSELDDLLGESDLMTLVELQKFLSDELAETLGTAPDLSRAFTPLTDGLGLESPEHRPEPQPIYPRASQAIRSTRHTLPSPFEYEEVIPEPRPTFSPPDADLESEEDDIPNLDLDLQNEVLADRALSKPRESLSQVMSGSDSLAPSRNEEVQPDEPEIESAIITEPPPMPQPSLFRRLLSGIVDEVFVISVWVLALVITSHSLSAGPGDISARLMKEIASPAFLRYAVLEFVALWLGYCLICLSLMDLTFGMWVWGMRVSYGQSTSLTGRWFRKLSRAWFTFLFLAPIVPTLLLVFRRKGRNLLDGLSGTQLYRTSV